jgi:hypothetical protein
MQRERPPAESVKSRASVEMIFIWIYSAFKKEAEELDAPAMAENIASVGVPGMDFCACLDQGFHNVHVLRRNSPEER